MPIQTQTTAQPNPNAAEFTPSADDVFGRIAGRYDLLCDIFSLFIHRLWKRRVAELIAAEPWQTLLDGATGTGDIILRVLVKQAKQTTEPTPPTQSMVGRNIIASDLSAPMLAIAQKRLAQYASQVSFRELNVEAMPTVQNSSVDAYSISLCMKICDRKRALGEALRVLKPGGRLIVLEASNIAWRPLHRAYLAYMHLCMPALGWLATGGDASAYRYLLHGVRDFPTAEALAAEMLAAGFTDVSFERLSLGIVAIHLARRPLAA
jgi:demethylmenaquinone methyltransferase / 2-methoxy-6-polyprenyl-1,4-benzoquinol methylase